MRVIEDNLRKHYDNKEDVITVFLALQRQNFALGNALKKPLWKIVLFFKNVTTNLPHWSGPILVG